ncbi:22211_t:CDS:2 [Gigaspora rosea]|nr:22211_t:CDS:2 [Gigaspora rosea]
MDEQITETIFSDQGRCKYAGLFINNGNVLVPSYDLILNSVLSENCEEYNFC